ncbi:MULTISPECIES: VWA domain-containing protein [unclassified Aminobacter]|uniref:vWA domain-containing protein n=1 Tax=unclassified Aminobacter TaxID=2644704 RepID=UPI0004670C28|nr:MULTISPECIES: VWA domain-containing protein [unclassified Aminobacter]TWG63471.1 Ca-activated chloride channel family protein [Aminobacter sp. J44]TWH31608.1 Ca-activated chloride channel family protein [Aminobacter sp. J15]
MRGLLRSILLGGMLAVSGTAATAADRAIIVLDGSGSMWGQIGGKPKLEIARETLRNVLSTLPDDLELGLMAYGHRQKGVCSDIELIVEPAAGMGSKIADAADRMRFIGMTPLSDAVKQAAESLRYTEEKATVILITDGIETCNADPCALASELEQSGVDFTAHVVGFGLSEAEGRKVACLAENTGGKFIQAKDAGSLKDALTQTVAAAPEPEPEPEPEPTQAVLEYNFVPTVALSEDTDDLKDGPTWELYKAQPDGSAGERITTQFNDWKTNLEPGNYVLRVRYGHAESTQLVTVEENQLNAPHFILNAGRVIIRPREHEGGEVSSGATIRFEYDGKSENEYGETDVILPAGEIKATVTIGEGSTTETFRLEAGRTVEKDIVVGLGRAAITVSYVPGMVLESGATIHIQKAAKRIDGTRETVRTDYNSADVALPAGDYYAEVSYQAAAGGAPFSVKVGERTEIEIPLNAGVLAVTAPEAAITRVYKAQKDLQGNRKQVDYSYDAEFQTTLNGGDYVVEVEYSGDKPKVEKAISVREGERVEITVP